MVEILNAEINLLGILLAAIADIAIGMLWYSPYMFGNTWMKIIGKQETEMSATSLEYVWSVLSALISAFLLSLFIYYANISSEVGELRDGFLFGEWSAIPTGILVAIFIWLGFIVTSLSTELIWEGRNRRLLGINLGYQLVRLLITGIILALMMDI
jgi:hypothetical protein